MTSSFKIALISCMVLLASLVPSRHAQAQNCENPETLRFSLVPTQNMVREVMYYEPILNLLTEKTGKKIDLIVPRSYSSIIDGLIGKWIDIAVLGPESYVIARGRDASIEPFGTFSRRADGIQPAGSGYHSVLITRKGSAFTSIESLKGSTLALVDKASTSGFAIPQTVFPKETGISPLKDYFSRIILTGKHDLSILAVIESKADAAFVASFIFMQSVSAGKVKLEDVNILWSSPRLPDLPFVYRGTLCENIRQAVAETFMSANQTEGGRKFLENVGADGMVKASDTDYNILRTIGK
ncbi:MAG: phosphate/phosphite/phosphonate ABC transporter substrate-binding protein [Rhodospirillaceae bacterium]